MGFLVTTLIFVVIGIIAALCTRICCNRGPSTNLVLYLCMEYFTGWPYFINCFCYRRRNHVTGNWFHLTLVVTATVCCWMMWAIVYLAQMKPLIVPVLSEGE